VAAFQTRAVLSSLAVTMRCPSGDHAALQLAADRRRRFEFAEQEPPQPAAMEPGLEQFLRDASLSGSVTEEEIAFLKGLKLRSKRPSAIYYYRELQNLRDPLHSPSAAQPVESD